MISPAPHVSPVAANRRLISAFRADVRLQHRNGLYYVAAAMVGIWAVIFSQLPPLNLGWVVPILVSGNLIVSTYYFMAGLVLLERAEGSLQALTVTPLRSREYLLSKTCTLTALATVENVAIVIFLYAAGGVPALASLGLSGWVALVAGTAAAGALYALIGFGCVTRYASINEFLIPSVLYTSVLSLPLVAALLQWNSLLLYLHPLQPSLTLMRAAGADLPKWEPPLSVVASAIWISLAFFWAKRSFDQHVVASSE